MSKFKTIKLLNDKLDSLENHADYDNWHLENDKEYISREDHLIELQKQRRAYVKRIKQLEGD